jgi:hypothetical protein
VDIFIDRPVARAERTSIGVIISSNDTRAQTLIEDLSADTLAATIITRVTNTVFGPAGRNTLHGPGGSRGEHSASAVNSHRSSETLRQQTQMDSREDNMLGDDRGFPLSGSSLSILNRSREFCLHRSQ